MATFPIWTIMSILEEVMDLLLSFWSPYWALFGLFRNQIIISKSLYTNLLAHQPRGDNSPHRFQIATFRAFPAKLGKTHRMITERHPPPFKKTWLKYKTFYNLLRCELDLKILTSVMFPRVLTEGSEYLSQCDCINIPIQAILFFIPHEVISKQTCSRDTHFLKRCVMLWRYCLYFF